MNSKVYEQVYNQVRIGYIIRLYRSGLSLHPLSFQFTTLIRWGNSGRRYVNHYASRSGIRKNPASSNLWRVWKVPEDLFTVKVSSSHIADSLYCSDELRTRRNIFIDQIEVDMPNQYVKSMMQLYGVK